MHLESFDYLASVSVVISFISIFLVVFQLQANTDQQKLGSLIHIYDINRQLLSLGFAHTELFEILRDTQDADPLWERRYLQLWLNQMALIHFIQRRGLFQADMGDSLEIDIRDFMAMENMQRHWRLHRQYYPASFQRYIDSVTASPESAVKGGAVPPQS